MKLHLRQIPAADSLHLEGEEDCPLTDLGNDDVRCAGPLRYALDAGVSEGALWVNGSLAQPVELTCVACLERFGYTIEVPNFAAHLELGGPETIDLGPLVREDLLLNLPSYPHCDRDGGRVCPAPPRNAAEETEKRKPDWSALDQLDL